MGKKDTKTEIIKCECGTHLLEVTHDAEYFEDKVSNKTRVRQEFWLAMFSYGNQKDGFWKRFKIIWNYFKTGKMHADQIILDEDEAKKLATFITNNIIETEK